MCSLGVGRELELLQRVEDKDAAADVEVGESVVTEQFEELGAGRVRPAVLHLGNAPTRATKANHNRQST